MFTIFSCPKPFEGYTKIHQYNAIQSWTLVHPDVQVILAGDEAGMAEAAGDLGCVHIPQVERNEWGTPVVSSIFRAAGSLARHELLCYVNADIILTSTLVNCLRTIIEKWAGFLMIGRRWDWDSSHKNIDFSQPDWEQTIVKEAVKNGARATAWQIDYFVFPKETYLEVPPFAIGRVRWDNWMIWYARCKNIPVVDASAFIIAIHQNHNYSHHPGGQDAVWNGPEAQRNMELAGGWNHIYGISYSSHKLIGCRGHSLIVPMPFSVPIQRCWRMITRLWGSFRHGLHLIREGDWNMLLFKMKKRWRLLREWVSAKITY